MMKSINSLYTWSIILNEETDALENETDDSPGDSDYSVDSTADSLETVNDETSESEENQAEQTSESNSEGDENQSEGEQSEGQPAGTAEPTATPDSYTALIEEVQTVNQHLDTFEMYAGGLFAVLGIFLGVYLIHDLFDSLKKL